MENTPDPTTEGAAYRAMLFGLVGDTDPAQIQRNAPKEVRALVASAGDKLRARPAPDEWSALELLGHIVDAEMVSTFRYRQIIAHDEPEIAPYDQDLWVRALAHNDADPDELLAIWEPTRAANLSLWELSTPAQRARFGVHTERGRETFEDTFRLIAGHDLFHLNQIRETLAAV